MKRWQKIVLILMLVAVVWSAVGFWIVGTSDCVVRASFTGLNNLFRIPREYYAIRGGDAVRVPGWIVMLMNPRAAGNQSTNQEATQWFAQLIYLPRAEMYENGEFVSMGRPWMDTDFSAAHRIYYDHWAGRDAQPNEGQLAVMRQAFRCLHDGDPSDFSTEKPSTGEKTLLSLMFASDGKTLVIGRGRTLYLPGPDGSFREVMECDKYGQFDYYWFP